MGRKCCICHKKIIDKPFIVDRTHAKPNICCSKKCADKLNKRYNKLFVVPEGEMYK